MKYKCSRCKNDLDTETGEEEVSIAPCKTCMAHVVLAAIKDVEGTITDMKDELTQLFDENGIEIENDK